MLTARCLSRALTRPQPAQLRQAAALYSRRSGLQHDGLGGWYNERLRATTILSVKKDDKLFIIGDGQVSLGSQVIKPNAKKVRKLKEGVVCGFAGATADAMTLFERLEMKLSEHPETMRACVEMAKAWRMDKYLRRLEAVMIVVDEYGTNIQLTGTGDVLERWGVKLTDTGDVLESQDGVIGIGSGGAFATAAARALLDVPGMDAEAIGRKAMLVAADLCVYTNKEFIQETLIIKPPPGDPAANDVATKKA